jgi:hypothetical protein
MTTGNRGRPVWKDLGMGWRLVRLLATWGTLIVKTLRLDNTFNVLTLRAINKYRFLRPA